MASTKRAKVSQEFQRPVTPSVRLFFINNDPVRITSVSRGMNIVYLYNVRTGKEQTMLYSDFKKHVKRAYSLARAGRILDRTPTMLNKYIRAGKIKPPYYMSGTNEPEFRKRAYYSEDDLYEIRDFMATQHRGRPRKDGRTTNSRVLTQHELRAKMGDALIMYTMTPEGEFIPTWRETTY